MKWLFILFLLAALGVFFAVRYRKQIQVAIYVWKMFRKMRQADKPAEKQIEKSENLGEVPLVKCAKCGTWTSQKNAMNLRSKIFYCSANCMESAVEVN